MQSIDLIRDNLKKSRDRVLARVEEMREHCVIFPTPNGGAHTLWVLGHLAYIEALVVEVFMLGRRNPLAEWEEVFDGADVSGDINQFPPFDQVLTKCRAVRESTLALIDSFSEHDLDKASAKVPDGSPTVFACSTSPTTGTCIVDIWPMRGGPLGWSGCGCSRMGARPLVHRAHHSRVDVP
jgi:hypothetical protein